MGPRLPMPGDKGKPGCFAVVAAPLAALASWTVWRWFR